MIINLLLLSNPSYTGAEDVFKHCNNGLKSMLYDECIKDLCDAVVNRVTFGMFFEEYPTKVLGILIFQ